MAEFEYEYDPVKYQKDGKEAERVIWTTKALNAAVKAMEQGLPLKANPFLGKNTRLLKPDLVRKYTDEELEDYIHCMKDPIYFGTKCFLKTPEGLQACDLRDYQENYIRHLSEHNFSIFLACRQCGKCFSLLSTIWIKLEKTNKTYEYLEKKYHNYIKDNYIYINIPIFELYHLLDNSILGNIRYYLYELLVKSKSNKLLYNLLSLLDEFDYKYIHTELTDGYKTIQEIQINNIEVLTDTGYKPITNFLLTKPFDQYILKLENGYELICADRHIFFAEDYTEVFCEDLHIGDKIMTDSGPCEIISIDIDYTKISMCDVSVDDDNHRLYTNGILSHNSVTTAIYCLWVILFNTDKIGLILSKSGPAGRDLLAKIKDMYLYLPYHLKVGTMKWNQSEISFDNNSLISTEPFGPTAGVGKTINFLILDEFAWCPPNDVKLFYENVIPTITTDPNANVCIMSTQNGHNKFYELWSDAIQKKNIYAPFKVDWPQVPNWDKYKKEWVKRDEDWHKKMIGIMGSEQAFQYMYGTQFSASDKCLVSREMLAKINNNILLFEPNNDLDIFLQFKDNLCWDPNFDINELKTGWFVLLCDLAEGGGNDFTVFHIIQMTEREIFKQVGYYRSNNVELELAALEFWLLVGQLFNTDRTIISIEWNTYGSLFYTCLSNYNEEDFKPEFNWRFNICNEIDLFLIARYARGNEENIPGISNTAKTKYIPGIRFSAGNKNTSCVLLKMLLEKELLIIKDIVTAGELENFEDQHGNGTYKAANGHDDIIMTLVQFPKLQQTPKYKSWLDDFDISKTAQKISNDIYGFENRLGTDIWGNPLSLHPWELGNLE